MTKTRKKYDGAFKERTVQLSKERKNSLNLPLSLVYNQNSCIGGVKRKKRHEEMGETGFRHDDQTPERNKAIGKAEQYAPDFDTFFETAL